MAHSPSHFSPAHFHGLTDLPIGTGPDKIMSSDMVESAINTAVLSRGSPAISDPITPVDALPHDFTRSGVPIRLTLPANTFAGVNGHSLQAEAGIRIALDDAPVAPVQVRLKLGPIGLEALIATIAIPFITGDIALRTSIVVNGTDRSFRASTFVVAKTSAKDAFVFVTSGFIDDLDVENTLLIDFAWAGGEDPGDSARLYDFACQAFTPSV